LFTTPQAQVSHIPDMAQDAALAFTRLIVKTHSIQLFADVISAAVAHGSSSDCPNIDNVPHGTAIVRFLWSD
jgi:hypothetical protein